MGWAFDTASWEGVEGAYYSAMGAEWLWLLVSVGCCVAALVVGAMHELDAYRKAER
ncbi:MAG: hypothetical protein AAFR17_17885 [Pseudomonadota bacterium]